MNIKKAAVNCFYVVAGSALFSLSVNMFSVPNGIVQGGLAGISIMINRIFPFIPVGLSVFTLNIPLFIIGYLRLGKGLVLRSIAATIVFTSFIDIGELFIPPYTGDIFLACVFCGVFAGIGLAFILLAGATTGGTEIIAVLIKQQRGDFSVGKLMMFVDLVVLTASYFVFRSLESTMYAVVTLFVTSKLIDLVLVGTGTGKAFIIISKNADFITQKILSEISRGVTVIPAKGGYTNENKQIIFCIVRSSQVSAVKRLVSENDKSAFSFVADIGEVMGQGFH